MGSWFWRERRKSLRPLSRRFFCVRFRRGGRVVDRLPAKQMPRRGMERARSERGATALDKAPRAVYALRRGHPDT